MPPLALAVIFLLLGLAILIAEVFLPSGGILAILSFASLAASIAAAHRALWENYPEWFWGYCGLVGVSVPASAFFGFWLLPRTPLGKRLLLEAPTPEEVDPYREERARLKALIGKRATAVTDHMPGGIVEVDGERLHAEARGPVPEAGEAVEIVAADGRRVFVKKVTDDPPETDPFADDSDAPAGDDEDPFGDLDTTASVDRP